MKPVHSPNARGAPCFPSLRRRVLVILALLLGTDLAAVAGDSPTPGARLRAGPITAAEREFWSFRPLADPAPPAVEGDRPVRNDIDRFLHARLAPAGLTMRPPADRRTLLRRVSFDLTGLPPTPEATDAFLGDDAPDAFDRVVERLLASRAHGERWGRHWLDVVRYADTAGETADYPTPLSYQYRDWVIRAIETDMPYDEFVRQQLAGDLLASDEPASGSDESAEARADRIASMRIATGFLAISRRFGFDVENYHHLTIQDTIDTVGQAFLGLSIGCARCHDHKYDPVTMTDYYAWYGIFESTRYSFPGSEEKKRPYDLFPGLPPDVVARRQAKHDASLAALDAEIARVRSELESASLTAAATTARRQRLDALTAEHVALERSSPSALPALVYGAMDAERPADARVQLRGDRSRPGDSVPRRNLEILGGQRVTADAGSGRRQLAEWLTSSENPLLARVLVNRVWQHHFGRGLVGTENDFGVRGERPTHPELLDWLASRFVESGWSVRAVHRLILASAAYRQSSAHDDLAAERDPDARLLWRFHRRRLSAEEIRDAMLLVSGQLDTSPAGPHPFPPVETWGFTQHAPFHAVYPSNRRGVYLMQPRLARDPFLALFDGADTNASTARRAQTTVPTQALYLMNSEFVHVQAEALARRVLRDASVESARIELSWRVALSRPPETDEVAEAASFLARYASALGDEVDTDARTLLPWSALARTLLTRNEFLFVD